MCCVVVRTNAALLSCVRGRRELWSQIRARGGGGRPGRASRATLLLEGIPRRHRKRQSDDAEQDTRDKNHDKGRDRPRAPSVGDQTGAGGARNGPPGTCAPVPRQDTRAPSTAYMSGHRRVLRAGTPLTSPLTPSSLLWRDACAASLAAARQHRLATTMVALQQGRPRLCRRARRHRHLPPRRVGIAPPRRGRRLAAPLVEPDARQWRKWGRRRRGSAGVGIDAARAGAEVL